MIQKVAAIGFETTKISNIIETFVDQNKIVQSGNDAQVLKQSENSHTYLKQYKSKFLPSITIADLMISLPTKLELNQTIHNLINAYYDVGTVKPLLGHFRFTHTLMECLAIHKKQSNPEKPEDDITIQYLLAEEIYSLDPKEYFRKLDNLKNFNRLMDKNLQYELNDDVRAQDILKQTELWKSDTNFMSRCHMYVKNVFELLNFYSKKDYTFDEVMNLNLYNVINEIIYKNCYEPERIENFAFNIKTNLIYVIACGATQMISCDNRRIVADVKMLESFLENLKDPSNETINDLLKDGSDFYQPNLFKISNHNIMYYIKKDNFLLAYLLKEIQKFEYQTLKYETNYLDNQRKLETVETLSVLFNGDMTLAALNYDQVNFHVLVRNLKSSNNYEHNLKILSSICEKQVEEPVIHLKDFYIEKLVLSDEKSYKDDRKFSYLEKLSDINKSAEMLLKSVLKIKSLEGNNLFFKLILVLPKLHDNLSYSIGTSTEKYFAIQTY